MDMLKMSLQFVQPAPIIAWIGKSESRTINLLIPAFQLSSADWSSIIAGDRKNFLEIKIGIKKDLLDNY